MKKLEHEMSYLATASGTVGEPTGLAKHIEPWLAEKKEGERNQKGSGYTMARFDIRSIENRKGKKIEEREGCFKTARAWILL